MLEMYAKNLYDLREESWAIDWDDEIIAGSCLTRDGELKHAGVKKVLGGSL